MKQRTNVNRKRFLKLVLTLLSVLTLAPTPQRVAQVPTANPPFSEIAPGIEYLQINRGTEPAHGPWLINLLRVDLARAELRFVRALDEAVGLETVSSLAARYAAVAGINSGYFRTSGTYRGESIGVMMINGKLLSETHNDRAAVGLIRQNSKTELLLGHLKFSGRLFIGPKIQTVNGVNRPVLANELILFTPEFHRTTLTNPNGVEAVVRQGRVTEILDLKGSSRIPADGFVVSASGSARDWIKKNVRLGSPVRLSLEIHPVDSSQQHLWKLCKTILGGGPQIIKDGKIEITNSQEKIAPAFVTDRHPRTAIAKLTSGKVLLATVDGRQPGISVGMSLPELASLLLEFGAVQAINLDGGGSTTMVVSNKIVNKPSDQAGERPVSDAILVFPRHTNR